VSAEEKPAGEDPWAEIDGVFASADVTTWCAQCGAPLSDSLEHEKPAEKGVLAELALKCEACSQKAGIRLVVPVVFLVGEQCSLVDAPLELANWLQAKHPAVWEQYLAEEDEAEASSPPAGNAPDDQVPPKPAA